MALFRRRPAETYNEQLLREAGLADQIPDAAPAEEPPAAEPAGAGASRPLLDINDIFHGGRSIGPDPWDATATLRAEGFEGDEITFVTLPGGDVLVEDEQGDRDVSPFADAVEQKLRPPYRATATRQTAELWSVGAKRLDVERIPFDDGDRLELTQNGDSHELRVDGEPSHDEIAELRRLGERAGADFYVHAARLDGDLWEVEVTPL